MNERIVIVQAAGLGYEFLTRHYGDNWNGLKFQPLESPFPALTCPAQAAFRTASPAGGHGIVANGLYHRELRRPLFWEQASSLVEGPRIWDSFRRRGGRVALLFWQQSLGESVDLCLSPAPIHKHGGGMIQSVYSQPAGLYEHLCRVVGARFNLHRYWGPLASSASSAWIARATAALLTDAEWAPDLCLTYLPALDYDLQRHGPDHPAGTRALRDVMEQLDTIRAAAERNGYQLIVYGDYAIGPVHDAVHPNRLLHDAGLFRARLVAGRSYPDFHASPAFAMVDHEIAHVYLAAAPGAARRETVAALFAAQPGIARVMGREEQEAAGVRHPRGGDLLLVAAPGYWFAYPWWQHRREAPDFAGHVDIHNKPGYDPCELYFGWPPISTGQDPCRIRGSHGRTGPDRAAAWASSLPLPGTPATLVDLAAALRERWGQNP